jgi:hypothetical protein
MGKRAKITKANDDGKVYMGHLIIFLHSVTITKLVFFMKLSI